MNEHTLLALVAHCDGDHLQERALDVCSWAIEQSPITARENIQHMAMDISQSSSFFREVANHLQDIPPTIVHGDLWAGNMQ